jgi:hypothetical protein
MQSDDAFSTNTWRTSNEVIANLDAHTNLLHASEQIKQL